MSSVAIYNFVMLKNNNGNNRANSILLDYRRKEYCANTCWHCKKFTHLGVARMRDAFLGIFIYPKTWHETKSHYFKEALPTIFNDIRGIQY